MNKLIKRLLLIEQTDKSQKGWLLVTAIIMILFITSIGFTISAQTAEQYQHTKNGQYQQNASLVAEAGIEQSVDQLNANSSFAGYTTPQTFFNNTTQGRGTFTSSVTTNSDGTSKTIISTANFYKNGNSASPFLTRKIRVTVVGTGSSGYSVLSGPGGLILTGSANITNSSVYVGGTITMTGASKIGTSTKPLTVDVANNACPTGSNPGATYPAVCTSTQPISLAYSTNIYGTVCATGQTSTGPNNNIQTGNGGGGLQVGCTAPVATPPTYDRAGQIAAVTTTSGATNSTYNCTGNKTIVWPANLELVGNVTVGNSCNLKINGNVYVTGTLTIGGAATITVANALGTNRPYIISDGAINVGGSAQMLANSSGTGIEFISFYTNAACNPNCTSLTGTALHTSQSLQTVEVDGAVKVPGMIFDAYWGEADIGGSGNVGAVTGQTVNLSGAGTVIFGTLLSSGTETWSITSYQPLYQ
ncbi:MAG TPA: hypothetical protein VIH90_00445 [Candidatus Saccharimonadales bacterium]